MEVNIQEKNEFYARITVKKLKEMAVQGDARAHFYAGKNEYSALIKI